VIFMHIFDLTDASKEKKEMCYFLL